MAVVSKVAVIVRYLIRETFVHVCKKIKGMLGFGTCGSYASQSPTRNKISVFICVKLGIKSWSED